MQWFSLYGVHKRDYQESVSIGQTEARTHTQTDAGQSDSYVPLCFAGDTKTEDDVFERVDLISLVASGKGCRELA